MQQLKYNPQTYNTETTTDITITPYKHRLCRNPKPVLHETKYAATEIQPWTYITEKATNITLSPRVRIDYVESPKIVLQKIEYAAAEIHPCTYIIEIGTLSLPISTDYAKNPKPILQKQNVKQQKPHHKNRNRYIFFLWVRIDILFFFVWRFKFV